LETTVEYLLGSGGKLIVEAHEKDGAKAARDVDELVTEVQGLFSGGRLDDEAMDGVMEALFTAYMTAKKRIFRRGCKGSSVPMRSGTTRSTSIWQRAGPSRNLCCTI